jgi:hypothetical protein
MRRKAIKTISLWILTIALIVAHIFFRSQAHAEQTGWKEIYTRSGECRITFPSLPQMIEQKLKLGLEGGHLSYDVYLAPYHEHSICVLLVAQYPKPVSPGSEMLGLEALLKGIISQHPENRLMFAEMVQMRGFPALNFMVESGKNFFRGQAVMVGNKLYMIAMEGVKQRFEESVFQQFLQSFQLMPSKKVSFLSKPIIQHETAVDGGP